MSARGGNGNRHRREPDGRHPQRRATDSLDQQLLKELPSARSWDTDTQAFIVKRPEVGGSTATTVSGGPKVFVYGSRDTAEVQIDGMSVMAGVDNPGTYASYDNMQEMTYSIGGGSAEQTSGALNVNMIPRTGGNQFHGDATYMFANHDMQGWTPTTNSSRGAWSFLRASTKPGTPARISAGASSATSSGFSRRGGIGPSINGSRMRSIPTAARRQKRTISITSASG